MNETKSRIKSVGLNVIFQHFYRSMNEDTPVRRIFPEISRCIQCNGSLYMKVKITELYSIYKIL